VAGWCLSYTYICSLPLLDGQNVHIHCQRCRVLTTWGKKGQFRVPHLILRKIGTALFKTNKTGMRGIAICACRSVSSCFSQIHRDCICGMKLCFWTMMNDESRGMHDEMTVFCLQVLPRHLPAATKENHWTLSSNISCKREFSRVTVKPVTLLIKGKAIPLQAWTGPEGSRRLRLPDFKTISTWWW
jgi:hypothetical protein